MIEPDLFHEVLYSTYETIEYEKWFLQDKVLHNPNAPAIIAYHPNGNKRYECWYINGKIHRKSSEIEEPAEIWYDIDGNIDAMQYYKYDMLHRLNGPAYVKYSTDGSLIYESWWENDEKHNLNGPAFIYYKDGKIEKEAWWEYGIEIVKD